jgi:hypothetical protein
MKHTIILLPFLLFGCNEPDTKTVVSTEQTTTIVRNDKEVLQQLTRKLYEWHETKGAQNDFVPLAGKQNQRYVALDMEKQNQRLTELKQTSFFAEQFLENYNAIALTIDEELKTKKREWLVGDTSPYGNEANPWCNCQDSPSNYWQTITVKSLTVENNTASFTWTWGDNFEYKIKAIKENESWKITYLQGFDFDAYIPTR